MIGNFFRKCVSYQNEKNSDLFCFINRKWDLFFLKTAESISCFSKDPSTKVGAVIIDHKRRIVGTGYNGFPRNIKDTKERYENRSLKYVYMIHAEVNAILNSKIELENCIIYTYPFPPCSDCAKFIIQSGIRRVVSLNYIPERWKSTMNVAMDMFKEAKIETVLYDINEYETMELKNSYE